MKIAFIGLGAMGFPMARHLSKQHELLVWNRTREKAERHAREHGTTVANDLADCANAAVVITMLPTSVEVDEIVDKLLPSLHPGTLWIDATSGDPNASKQTAARLGKKGVAFVDAPVTGATVGAENATLTIMIGGDAADFERAREILQLCGKTIIHAGTVGSGHAIKVLNNTIMAATVWITSECLLLDNQFGIDQRSRRSRRLHRMSEDGGEEERDGVEAGVGQTFQPANGPRSGPEPSPGVASEASVPPGISVEIVPRQRH